MANPTGDAGGSKASRSTSIGISGGAVAMAQLLVSLPGGFAGPV